MVEELVQEEADDEVALEESEVDVAVEDCSALVAEVSSTDGLLSLSSVTGGKLENSGKEGHSNTPGPEPNPKSSRPLLPQNGQPNKIGMIVWEPSSPVVVR